MFAAAVPYSSKRDDDTSSKWALLFQKSSKVRRDFEEWIGAKLRAAQRMNVV